MKTEEDIKNVKYLQGIGVAIFLGSFVSMIYCFIGRNYESTINALIVCIIMGFFNGWLGGKMRKAESKQKKDSL